MALRVAEDLDLDVARAGDVTLDQHVVVTEAGLGFALARSQGLDEVFGTVDAPHALAATAGAGLDEHRVADARGLGRQEGGLVVVAVVAGHQRHAGLVHQRLGRALAAHGGNGAGRRADEHQALFGASLGEVLVLAQEAVARVDGLRAGGLGGVDDALPLQVAVAWRVAAHVHRLVAGTHVAGLRVGVGVDGHGAHAQAARGGGHTAGDFAAVGDQDLLEHGSARRG